MNSECTNAYIPVIDKYVPIIKSQENRFFIPAHNEIDWKYANENGIRINQVVAPYFYGKGEESVRDDVETQKRHSVIAVIKHSEEDKYLCLDCKGRTCRSFVLGGIENGETAEEAAIREVKEETGYTDLEITYKSPISLINHFYAGYKGVNRYAKLDIVFGRLRTDKNIGISQNEAKKHIVKWVEKYELNEFISVDNNKYALDILLNGDKPYIKDGIVINSNNLNDMPSEKARKVIGDKLM
ncbi:MAG: NUDIX domain-containing protein [Clostridiales bacterium]|nr:NUDIX domain-containing protein [Clostridiales bacterium]